MSIGLYHNPQLSCVIGCLVNTFTVLAQEREGQFCYIEAVEYILSLKIIIIKKYLFVWSVGGWSVLY